MKICIFYFSGTGNTKIVTDLLKYQLSTFGNEVSVFRIDKNMGIRNQIDYSIYEMIGIGCPIYGLGTPKIIVDFVKTMPSADKKKVFLFKTAADFIWVNHSASDSIIKILYNKGYDVFYDRIIAMGSNWFVEYDDRLVKQLYVLAKKKIEHMSKEIVEEKKRRYKRNIFLFLTSSIISFFEDKLAARLFGISLKTDDKCNNCGKCIKDCPVGNISKKGTTISFSNKCIWCMKCVYSCPQNSIKSRGMNFCIFKKGYNIKRIVDDVEGEFVIKDTKGFYRHFLPYLNDESI